MKSPNLISTYNYPKYILWFNSVNRRILTLIGRVTIARTLILLKLNHLFISFPSPKKSLLYGSDYALLCHMMIFFLHYNNNVFMMQFNSIISAISKFWQSVTVKKSCIKKPVILSYQWLLYEKCTKCIYQLPKSNSYQHRKI